MSNLSTNNCTAGSKLRQAAKEHAPLLMPGVINGYCAKLAESEGFAALYLSGGGVAAAMGLPDLAVTTMHDVLLDAERITDICAVPLLVDVDTGFGSWLSIARTARAFCRAGVAGIHLEDQTSAKRCGHRPNKQLATPAEMADRVRAAVDARPDDSFVIMARTDALASESRQQAIARACLYAECGADMIFVEAAQTLDDYRDFRAACKKPVLANITEFGQTPMFSAPQLAAADVDIMLFPLSAFRAMNQAALNVYRAIRQDGNQQAVIPSMQTREELYDYLNYHAYEQKMDKLFGEDK
ncbi:MAG: methylisocitrate lyase [Gammaproteobacteria bacterium]